MECLILAGLNGLMQWQGIFYLEQDRGLEELSKIIGRQRQMAQAIGEEVESQNGK